MLVVDRYRHLKQKKRLARVVSSCSAQILAGGFKTKKDVDSRRLVLLGVNVVGVFESRPDDVDAIVRDSKLRHADHQRSLELRLLLLPPFLELPFPDKAFFPDIVAICAYGPRAGPGKRASLHLVAGMTKVVCAAA